MRRRTRGSSLGLGIFFSCPYIEVSLHEVWRGRSDRLISQKQSAGVEKGDEGLLFSERKGGSITCKMHGVGLSEVGRPLLNHLCSCLGHMTHFC